MTTTSCIDLKEQFGQRYRITTDPAVGPRNSDPWYWVVPCKYGEIYPYGGEVLCAMVTSTSVANKMRTWPELLVHQDAEDAVIFQFHVNDFKIVADRMMARKRRQVSPETMKKIGASTAYGRGKAGKVQRSPLEPSPNTPPSVLNDSGGLG